MEEEKGMGRPFYARGAFPVIVTLLLTLLFTAVIAYGVQGLAGAAGEVSEGAQVNGGREFHIQAEQWDFTPAAIRAYPGEKVRFIVTTQDIMHGFAINELGLNLQLSPGEEIVQEVEIPADMHEGYYTMYCSIFCGIGHPYMKGTLIIGNPTLQTGRVYPYIATLGMAGVFTGFIVFKRRAK